MNKITSFESVYNKCHVAIPSKIVLKKDTSPQLMKEIFTNSVVSPHPALKWIPLDSNLEKSSLVVDGRSIGCHVASRRVASFRMKMLETNMKIIFEDIFKGLKNATDQNPNAAVQVNFKTAFVKRAKEVLNCYDATKPIMKEAQSYIPMHEKSYGLTFKEQCEITKKVIEDVTNWLADANVLITKDVLAQSWKITERHLRSMIVENRQKCQVNIVQPKVVLSLEDRQFLGLKDKEELKKLEEMPCYNYAFLKVREKKAIDWIKNSLPPPGIEHQFLKVFQNLGYALLTPTERGELLLKAGDLVVYVSTPEEKEQNTSVAQLNHVAVLQEDGRCISKMGFTESSICEHSIRDVPGFFGRHILFFRKNSQAQ